MVKNQLRHMHKGKDDRKRKKDDRNMKGYKQVAICDCASSLSCSIHLVASVVHIGLSQNNRPCVYSGSIIWRSHYFCAALYSTLRYFLFDLLFSYDSANYKRIFCIVLFENWPFKTYLTDYKNKVRNWQFVKIKRNLHFTYITFCWIWSGMQKIIIWKQCKQFFTC